MAIDPKTLKLSSKEEILDLMEEFIDNKIKMEGWHNPFSLKNTGVVKILLPSSYEDILYYGSPIFTELQKRYKKAGWKDFYFIRHERELHLSFDFKNLQR